MSISGFYYECPLVDYNNQWFFFFLIDDFGLVYALPKYIAAKAVSPL